MGVTVRLESALDLVKKKTERAKERHWREQRDESILKKLIFPKTFKVGFVSIYISSNLLAKTLFTKCRQQTR